MAEPMGFESFFEDQRSKVFGAMCLVTGNRQEAEEITQDAFMRLWERWDPWPGWRTRPSCSRPR